MAVSCSPQRLSDQRERRRADALLSDVPDRHDSVERGDRTVDDRLAVIALVRKRALDDPSAAAEPLAGLDAFAGDADTNAFAA